MPEKLEYRVEQLESKVCDIGADVKLIMRNHLPHIQTSLDVLDARFDGVDSRLKWIFGLIAGGIMAIVGSLIGIALS